MGEPYLDLRWHNPHIPLERCITKHCDTLGARFYYGDDAPVETRVARAERRNVRINPIQTPHTVLSRSWRFSIPTHTSSVGSPRP